MKHIPFSNPVQTKIVISGTSVKNLKFTEIRKIKAPSTKFNQGPINPRGITPVSDSE
jgi:hypothetical protein